MRQTTRKCRPLAASQPRSHTISRRAFLAPALIRDRGELFTGPLYLRLLARTRGLATTASEIVRDAQGRLQDLALTDSEYELNRLRAPG